MNPTYPVNQLSSGLRYSSIPWVTVLIEVKIGVELVHPKKSIGRDR